MNLLIDKNWLLPPGGGGKGDQLHCHRPKFICIAMDTNHLYYFPFSTAHRLKTKVETTLN